MTFEAINHDLIQYFGIGSLTRSMVDYFETVKVWKEPVINNASAEAKTVASDSIVRRFIRNSIMKTRAKLQIGNHHLQSAGLFIFSFEEGFSGTKAEVTISDFGN